VKWTWSFDYMEFCLCTLHTASMLEFFDKLALIHFIYSPYLEEYKR